MSNIIFIDSFTDTTKRLIEESKKTIDNMSDADVVEDVLFVFSKNPSVYIDSGIDFIWKIQYHESIYHVFMKMNA